MDYTLLLVEDDPDFGKVLQQYLELSGFRVHWSQNGRLALEKWSEMSFDLAILDVMMPEMDGFTLAEKILKLNPETTFLFLTAKSLKEDRIKGLKLGATDYIQKPCEVDELVLKIRNILNRTQKPLPSEGIRPLSISSYFLDPENCVLRHPESEQRLTERELLLIGYLARHPNQLIRKESILLDLWGSDDYFTSRSMDVFISRLRKYFRFDKRIEIRSYRGIGIEFHISD